MATTRLRPRKQPRQERARATVEAILEAAAQVFERHGYAAGTTNRIAKRAGISIGSLYQYFPGKDAILLAIVERHVADATRALTPLLAGLLAEPPPLREGVRRVVEAMAELHRDRPRLHRVLFEEAPRPPRLRRQLDDLAAAAATQLAAYLRACPEALVADPDLAARLIVQVTESITHNLVIHPASEHPPEAWIEATVDMLAAYATG